MSLKPLTLATLFTIILSGMVTGLPEGINAIAQNQMSLQSSSINLNATELNQPLWLQIQGINQTNIQGQVTVNGQVIKTLEGSNNQVNLSNHLSQGSHQIIVMGNYYPSQGSVVIELKGHQTQVTQQTSGNGLLNQQLNMEVR
ncbi:hypothetical protein [Crocosphaera chwakensis]|uniref:Uncharacterized protein n=1 Tax=Crocosphaera chwakensis CCY0110 TaxID=391612 RepID=A3IY64_9CHRO|nr:hypothetical protein [Crocosphaera chwakensis]EAZ88585.1 hypothetical protein CY0110_21495 [Crocosphaera chwakensis CCY0110]